MKDQVGDVVAEDVLAEDLMVEPEGECREWPEIGEEEAVSVGSAAEDVVVVPDGFAGEGGPVEKG
jgi:hypothetical protein